MKEFQMRVRRDGSICIPKRFRTFLNIKPGATIDVDFTDGQVVMTPHEYVCPICGEKRINISPNTGVCEFCDLEILIALRNKPVTSVDEAYKLVKRTHVERQNSRNAELMLKHKELSDINRKERIEKSKGKKKKAA